MCWLSDTRSPKCWCGEDSDTSSALWTQMPGKSVPMMGTGTSKAPKPKVDGNKKQKFFMWALCIIVTEVTSTPNIWFLNLCPLAIKSRHHIMATFFLLLFCVFVFCFLGPFLSRVESNSCLLLVGASMPCILIYKPSLSFFLICYLVMMSLPWVHTPGMRERQRNRRRGKIELPTHAILFVPAKPAQSWSHKYHSSFIMKCSCVHPI